MGSPTPTSVLLPQDLSRQSDLHVLKPLCHNNYRRFKACLPPIDTFSHNRLESTGSRVRNRRNKRPVHTFFCQWPNCKHALNRVPFKYLCLLKRHTLWHKEPKPVQCPQCGLTFRRKINLDRHQLIHKGLKPYVCEVCKRAYSRTAERSRCRKHHRLVSELPNPLPVSLTSPMSALEVETALDRARPRPYKCPICGERRAYTDSGSLRKHMRRYHPNERASSTGKKSGVSGTQIHISSTSQRTCLVSSSNNATQLVNTHLAAQPVLLETDSEPVYLSETDTPSKYSSQLIPVVAPTYLYDPLGTSLDPSTGLYTVYIVDQPITLPAGVESQVLNSNRTIPPYLDAASNGNAPVVNSPVNLCNSNVGPATTVDEVCDLSVDIDLEPQSEMRMLPGFGIPSSTQLDVFDGNGGENFHRQDDALDLTEPQYFQTNESGETAIDLSGDASLGFPLSLNPVDLSASQNTYSQLMYDQDTSFLCAANELIRGQNSLLNWDPEPGFSFTDLLTNTDLEETDTLLFNVSSSGSQDSPLNFSPAKPVLRSGLPPPLDLRLFQS